MIHVFVGTKAQFIKMAPIMQELDNRNIPFNFIDAGQHSALTADLIPQFELRQPDVFLRSERNDITTIPQAVIWTIKSLAHMVFRPRKIFREVFRGQKGICLIHGDTLTTLISALYAKRCGLKVAHVEAGMRSFHLLDPFPEEIIRLIAMRLSDVLFAPSDDTFENLRRLGYIEKTRHVGLNTIADTVRYAAERLDKSKRPIDPYVVVTTHRVETIYSARRLAILVELVERIALERKVLFVLHGPTEQQLEKNGFYDRLIKNSSVEMMPLQTYLTFVGLLAGADFVVTDGGSIQEECYLLDVPCLIMRSNTEHIEGLGEIAFLAEFDQDQIDEFLEVFPTMKRQEEIDDVYPSRTIIDHVSGWA